MNHTELARSAARGVMWTGISQIGAQVVRLGTTVVLARLIAPEDFGVLSMALIVTGLVQLVNELGLSTAIIQRKEVTEDHLTTALIAAVISGTILMILTILLSPLVAAFFRQPLVRPVLSVLSAGFVLGAFGSVQRALLQKALRFDRVTGAELGGETAFALIGIVLALLGLDVWALVGGTLARYAASAALLWRLGSWWPAGRWQWSRFRELFGFGVNVLGTQIVNYTSSNLDYLIVGRVLGDAPLGFYTLAYQLTMFPRMRISSMITRVAFPAFAHVQDDPVRLRRGYTRLLNYVSLITFPLVAGLLAIAPELVPLVFGPRWAPAIRPIQLLAIGGLLASVGTTVGSVLKGIGRPDVELRLNLVSVGLLAVALLVGVRYGIIGVAAAVSLKTLLMVSAFAWAVTRLIGLPFRTYLRALTPAILATGAMLIGLTAYRLVAGLLGITDWTLLLTSVPLGAGIYLVTLRLAYARTLTDLVDLLRSAVGLTPRTAAL